MAEKEGPQAEKEATRKAAHPDQPHVKQQILDHVEEAVKALNAARNRFSVLWTYDSLWDFHDELTFLRKRVQDLWVDLGEEISEDEG